MPGALQHIMNCQEKFQKDLGVWPHELVHMGDTLNAMDLETQEELHERRTTTYIRNHGQYCVDELSEMYRELPFYKSWKDYEGFDREKHLQLAREEWIDAFHFIINIGIALGMDEQMVLDMYNAKHNINEQRQADGYGFNDF